MGKLQPAPEGDQDGVAAMLLPRVKDAVLVGKHSALAPDDLHCTLVFYGMTGDLPSTNAQQMADRVSDSIAQMAPVHATLGGLARFSLPEQDAVVVLVDSKGVQEVRDSMLENIDVPEGSDHGYTPHMTLGYLSHRYNLPMNRWEPQPVVFDRLRIAYGDEHVDMKLGTVQPNGKPNSLDAAQKALTQLYKHIGVAAKVTGIPVWLPDGSEARSLSDVALVRGETLEATARGVLDHGAPTERIKLEAVDLLIKEREARNGQHLESKDFRRVRDPAYWHQPYNSVIVPSSVMEHGQKPYLGDSHEGITIRGQRKIDVEDLPPEVYHMTTNLPAVNESGYLRASGEGGLGGDEKDRVVSFTTSKKIANHLVSSMRSVVIMARSYDDKGDRLQANRDLIDSMQAMAKREGWEWKDGDRFKSDDLSGVLGSYGFSDVLRQFLMARSTKTGEPNPIIFTRLDQLRAVDPRKIGSVTVPRENLDTGALIMDFDVGQGLLDEVRIYGNVPLRKTKERGMRNEQSPEAKGPDGGGGRGQGQPESRS